MNPSIKHSLTVYQPSGKIGLRAYLVWLLVCAPMAIVLGVGLAWAQSYAHGWIASSICASLYSLFVYLICGFVVGSLHARNRAFLTAAGVVFSVLLLATRWAFVLFTCPDCTISAGAWLPSSLSAYVGAFLEGSLMLVWCAFSFRIQIKTPYSETQHAWAIDDFVLELWCTQPDDPLTQSLQEFGVQYLIECPRASDLAVTPASTRWQTLKITGRSVSTDPVGCWLTIAKILHTRGTDGKVTSQSDDFLTNWCVSGVDYESVRVYSSGPVADASGSQVSSPSQANESIPTPKELVAAVEAMQASQFSVALRLATGAMDHPDAAVRTDALRICAQSKGGLLQWKDAATSYEALFAIEPTEFNALQIAATLVMAKELASSSIWYERAMEINQTSRAMPPARICTAYLSALEQAGELAAVQPHLDWLADGYRNLRVTDDNFVWASGFPFFAEFLRKSKELMRKSRSDSEIKTWYQSIREDLDEEGQQAIDRHLVDWSVAD